MKKLILVFFFLFSGLQALDIDPKTLQEIVADDPSALKERVILARYYQQQGNDLKALVLLKEILDQDADNK